jgi:hypothetical protein
MVTTDYLTKQVETLHLLVTRLLLHKDVAAYALPAALVDYSDDDRLCVLVRACIAHGDYADALELLDTHETRFTLAFAEIALEAYAALNALSDDTLEADDVERTMLEAGVKALATERGFALWN